MPILIEPGVRRQGDRATRQRQHKPKRSKSNKSSSRAKTSRRPLVMPLTMPVALLAPPALRTTRASDTVQPSQPHVTKGARHRRPRTTEKEQMTWRATGKKPQANALLHVTHASRVQQRRDNRLQRLQRGFAQTRMTGGGAKDRVLLQGPASPIDFEAMLLPEKIDEPIYIRDPWREQQAKKRVAIKRHRERRAAARRRQEREKQLKQGHVAEGLFLASLSLPAAIAAARNRARQRAAHGVLAFVERLPDARKPLFGGVCPSLADAQQLLSLFDGHLHPLVHELRSLVSHGVAFHSVSQLHKGLRVLIHDADVTHFEWHGDRLPSAFMYYLERKRRHRRRRMESGPSSPGHSEQVTPTPPLSSRRSGDKDVQTGFFTFDEDVRRSKEGGQHPHRRHRRQASDLIRRPSLDHNDDGMSHVASPPSLTRRMSSASKAGDFYGQFQPHDDASLVAAVTEAHGMVHQPATPSGYRGNMFSPREEMPVDVVSSASSSSSSSSSSSYSDGAEKRHADIDVGAGYRMDQSSYERMNDVVTLKHADRAYMHWLASHQKKKMAAHKEQSHAQAMRAKAKRQYDRRRAEVGLGSARRRRGQEDEEEEWHETRPAAFQPTPAVSPVKMSLDQIIRQQMASKQRRRSRHLDGPRGDSVAPQPTPVVSPAKTSWDQLIRQTVVSSRQSRGAVPARGSGKLLSLRDKLRLLEEQEQQGGRDGLNRNWMSRDRRPSTVREMER